MRLICDRSVHTTYAKAIAPIAAATSAAALFEVSSLPAAPVDVAVGAELATAAAPAVTKVAVCVIVAVSSTVPDTVVVTTTVRVVKPVSEAVTVYHPLPFGVPQAPHGPGPPHPPHPPHPAGQSEQALDVQAEDQDEQTEDWKDQTGAVGMGVGQAALTQLESAEPVAQWLAQAVGSG
jgi:hypothetical protein